MYITPDMIPHVKKIFAGEYDVPISIPNPVILDIGANIGAFARWAFARWQYSEITCFEPVKATFEILRKNTQDIPGLRSFGVAIGSSDRKQKIYYGKNNMGEASLFQSGQQTEVGEEIEVVSAAKLPPCNIMKIDTEGSEIEILSTYDHTPEVFLIEYHSEENRLKIDDLLRDKYMLIASSSDTPNYGVVKYGLKIIFNSVKVPKPDVKLIDSLLKGYEK